MSELAKGAANPQERTAPLLARWVAFSSAFVCFVVAGQLLTSRAGELYESLGVELPRVTSVIVEQSRALAATSILWGLGLLAASRARVRPRRIGSHDLEHLNAVALVSAAFVGVAVVGSSVLPLMRLRGCLMQ